MVDNWRRAALRWGRARRSRDSCTSATALASGGRKHAHHLVAFRSMSTITIVASVRPFSEGDVEIVRAFLRGRGYDGVYFPGIRPDEVNRYNVLPDPAGTPFEHGG